MEIITDCKKFYKEHYTLKFFIKLFYKYIINILCIIYILWFPIYIIKSNNFNEFFTQNITNITLIFYSIYKIYSSIIKNCNIIIELIFECGFYMCVFYDVSKHHYLYEIELYIISSLSISIFIFIFGTLYCIFRLDFDKYNEDLYYEYIADICGDTV